MSSSSRLDLDAFLAIEAKAKAGNEHAEKVLRDRLNLFRTERLQKASSTFPGDLDVQSLIQALSNDAVAPTAAVALSSSTRLVLDAFRAIESKAKAGNMHADKVIFDRLNSFRTQRLQRVSL